jgi:hypothetical protein
MQPSPSLILGKNIWGKALFDISRSNKIDNIFFTIQYPPRYGIINTYQRNHYYTPRTRYQFTT